MIWKINHDRQNFILFGNQGFVMKIPNEVPALENTSRRFLNTPSQKIILPSQKRFSPSHIFISPSRNTMAYWKPQYLKVIKLSFKKSAELKLLIYNAISWLLHLIFMKLKNQPSHPPDFLKNIDSAQIIRNQCWLSIT